MLYVFLRCVMWVVLPVYYRKIHLSGMENIPSRGPCLLACNHPNSFLDAIIIAFHCPREVHFLTRSDVFNAPWKKWILSKMNMVPIYRLRDGLENLDKNQETFEKCREVFRAGGVILIFSEGICIQELKLRPLKKGTARIALDFIQSGRSLTVVPVGLNYLHPMKARKEVFMGIAPCFDALEFKEAYLENPAKAILLFNKKLEGLLRQTIVHVEDLKWEKAMQRSLELALNERSFSLGTLVKSSAALNTLFRDQTDLAQAFQSRMQRYFDLVNSYKLEDSSVLHAGNSRWIAFDLLLYLPGFVLSYVPFALIRRLVRKKVRLAEFYDSVLVAGGMIFSLVFTIVLLIVSAVFYIWLPLAVLAGILIFSQVSTRAYDRLRRFILRTRYNRMSEQQKSDLEKARAELSGFVRANLLHDSTPSSLPSISATV